MSQQSPYQLPPRSQTETPSWVKTGMGLGVGLIVLGVVVAAIAGGSVLSALTRGTHSVKFPGSHNLKLKGGLHVGIPAPQAPLLTGGIFVTVTDVATGEALAVQTGADMTVALEGPSSKPLFQFETYDPGTYQVTGTVSASDFPVLILHESLGRTRSDLIVGLLAGTLLVTGGVVLMVYTRKRRKKLLGTFSPSGR
ncbi:MAG: hypothetical protein IPN19_08585 [Elusimicrobia bacterium]|nr:hypothetical protein [Elusimicrobiota bacterium]